MTTRLGLCISSDSVQAVELECDGPMVTLSAIGEWHGASPDGFSVLGDRLRAFIAANGVRSTAAAVALDTRRMFVHTFPDNRGTSQEDLLAHAIWERAQFFPEVASEDHITDVAPIGHVSPTGIQDYLAVSLLRRDVRNIRKSIESAGMHLSVLDADHFGAETLALQRFPDAAAERLLVAGVKSDRIDFSILDQGAVVRYAARSGATPEVLIDVLVSASHENEGLQHILLYGSAITPDLLTKVHQATRIPTHALDPFAAITVPADLPLVEHFISMPHRFVPAIGIALRDE